MQAKLLNEIMAEVAGKQASEVLDLLIGKKDVNEFLIAKKLKLTINQVRNIFYKLSNFGLVSFTRKKDKKKGWYTYFWTLNTGRALELLDKKIKREIESLEHQLKSRETKRFYLCNTCKTEISEDTALLHDFSCPECGEVYHLNEDKKIFDELRNRTDKLKRQRKEVLEELEKVREIKRKKIEKEAEKLKKEKARKRKLKAAKRKREKMKEAAAKAKPKKKPVKKKIVKKKLKKKPAKKSAKKKKR